MIAILAKFGAALLFFSAIVISFLYFLGILIVGIILFAILLFILFLLLAGVLALYYSLTKKPHLEKGGDWEMERVKGK
jgi:hypothetical protein